MQDLHIPGSPEITTAAVGPRGTVVIGRVADTARVDLLFGKPYCGSWSLEPAIAGMLKASRAVGEALRGPLCGKPVVHAVLVAPGVVTAFVHLDVLVVWPEGLAGMLASYPEVHDPDAVGVSLSVLQGLAGEAVPRSFPGKAPHERSAAEISSILERPAPPATPQPWRDWSVGAAVTDRRRVPTGAARRPARSGRGHRRRQLVTFAMVAIVGGGAVWYSHAHPVTTWPSTLRALFHASSPRTAIPLTVRTTTWTMPAVPPTTVTAPVVTSTPELPTTTYYPGQHLGDIFANQSGAAVVSGITVSLTDPTATPATIGPASLCASVSMRNGSASEVAYDISNWSVQYPSGDVQQPEAIGTDNDLVSGRLIPGGSVTGKLCFDNPSQAGLYVLSFQPKAEPVATAARAVWLVKQP